MNKIRKVNNCTYLNKTNSAIIIDIEDNSYFNEIPLNISCNTIVYNYQNKFYCYENGKLLIINSNTGKLAPVFYYEASTYINPIKDFFLVFNRVSRTDKSYSLIDSKKNILWVEKEKVDFIIIDDFLFRQNKNDISIIDLFTGSPLWSYTLPEGYTIYGNIQLVEDILFFEAYTKFFKNNKKIGIHIKTGDILWELDYLVTKESRNVADILNEKDKKCYGYYMDLYQVFDPIKGKIILEKDMSSYYKQGIEPTKNAIYDNRLWFVSGKGKDIKFGAINLLSSEIEFIQDFPITEKGQEDEQFDTPVYHNGKLYLRGIHYKTLYVFEE